MKRNQFFLLNFVNSWNDNRTVYRVAYAAGRILVYEKNYYKKKEAKSENYDIK